MDTSIFSLIVRCLYCSALILILCGCCHSRRLFRRLGPAFLTTAFAACVIRLLVPFNVVWIYHPALYGAADAFRLFLEKPLKSGGSVRAEQLIMLFWLTGFLVIFFRKSFASLRLLQRVSQMPAAGWKKLFADNGLDGGQFDALAKCRLVRTGQVASPCLVGIFHPSLLLPDVVYKKEELRYILLHEQLHVKKKDVLRKLTVDLLWAFFWWDPAFYFLRREYFAMIEMKADLEIAGPDVREHTIPYMECLKNTAVRRSGGPAFEISFTGSRFGELKRRMELLADVRLSRWQQLLAVLLLSAALAASASYLLPPFHYAMLYGKVPVTPDTACLVKNGESYDVYINGRYVYRVGEPERFACLPIYENREAYLREREEPESGEM